MNRSITRLVPGAMRAQILSLMRRPMSAYLRQVESQIPKYQLEKKHLQNARLLPTREHMLEQMPEGAIVAELGVDTGDFSATILSTCKPKKFHLVDFWGSKRYNQEKKDRVFARFQHERENGQVEIHLGLSTTVVDDFSDQYFDWIYIDTDHTYRTTYSELLRYAPKMKAGGIIAGHDYSVGNWIEMRRYGVVEAVQQFCVEHGWEIIWLTMETGFYQSFAIRRIE